MSQDDSWIDDLASGPEAHTLKQGFAHLQNEVERLTQENTHLREQPVCRVCGDLASVRWISPAERDVVEKAKAWRAGHEVDESCTVDERALAAAVDALGDSQ